VANTINSFQGNGATSVTTSRPQQPQRDNTAATTTGNSESGSSAEVQITSTASQLASLGQQLSAMPAINSARVGQISQSLADGTYTISADKIASGLMQSDQALAQIGV
jgi:negative regulator of flagellin synthesis FlgM